MNIASFQIDLDFIKEIYLREEWKDEKCRDEILDILEEAYLMILNAFGNSLHRINVHKPSIEALTKVVQKFPSTLSYRNMYENRIPIQTAAVSEDYSALQYIPVLAQEGVKYSVGGEEARGGLLKIDPKESRGGNVTLESVHSARQRHEVIALQSLCKTPGNDSNKVNVLKELEQLKLLKKKDVLEQNLLSFATKNQDCKERFHYLASLDPSALLEFDASISHIIPAKGLEIMRVWISSFS